MSKLIMSIKPEHVNNILAGVKKFEFRKRRCRERIDCIVIYSTAPVMKIVGEVEVKGIVEGDPQEVWNKTSFAAGIDKRFYDSYFDGKNVAIAYALGEVKRYKTEKKLSDYGIKYPPQSYVYVR